MTPATLTMALLVLCHAVEDLVGGQDASRWRGQSVTHTPGLWADMDFKRFPDAEKGRPPSTGCLPHSCNVGREHRWRLSRVLETSHTSSGNSAMRPSSRR